MPGYMQQQKPGAQIMCAVRSSAIVLPKDTRGFQGKRVGYLKGAFLGCVFGVDLL